MLIWTMEFEVCVFFFFLYVCLVGGWVDASVAAPRASRIGYRIASHRVASRHTRDPGLVALHGAVEAGLSRLLLQTVLCCPVLSCSRVGITSLCSGDICSRKIPRFEGTCVLSRCAGVGCGWSAPFCAVVVRAVVGARKRRRTSTVSSAALDLWRGGRSPAPRRVLWALYRLCLIHSGWDFAFALW